MFKLLCCDGGGIRGLMTALLIQDLERDFQVIGRADGFAGTSTGGLIALALARGVSIEDVVRVYETKGAQIFKENTGLSEQAAKARVAVQSERDVQLDSGPGFWSCQYTNTGLIDLAENLLGAADLAGMDKYVAVNSAQLWDADSQSWHAQTLSNAPGNGFRTVRLVDAALATAAAPTYFPPYRIAPHGYFADGGTFANNPAMSALADARHGGHFARLDEARVLSLGTGEVPQGITPEAVGDPLDWGAYYWMYPLASGSVPAMPLLDLMMTATAQEAAQQGSQLLGNYWCRGNVPMQQPVALDDYRKVDILRHDAEAYMRTESWQCVRRWVRQTWV